MTRRSREDGATGIIGMSGWLFADMLLVLAIVALGAMLASRDSVEAYVGSLRPTPSGSASATPNPKPSATPKPKPTATSAPGLSKDPQRFTLVFSTSSLLRQDPKTIASVRAQIRARTEGYKAGRAGFVLTFGGDANAGTATRVAEIVNAQLVAVRPRLFKGAVLRDFIRLRDSNQADVEIFLYR